jgi:hypothetical protein
MRTTKTLAILVLALGFVSSARAHHWVVAGDNMYADITGKVGIGTDSPTEKLTVRGNIGVSNGWRADGVSYAGVLEGNAVDGAMEWWRLGMPPNEPLRVILARSHGYLGGLKLDPHYPLLPGYAIGVYGEATGGFFTPSYGGYFESDSGWGYGVYGHATNTGDYKNYGGYFIADSERGCGVYAKGGAEGYAAEFDGIVSTKILEITGGADLSERFEIRSKLPDATPTPGMVVSIDPANPGGLIVSDNAYDRKVAGIISGAGGVQTGMMMGQKGSKADGKRPVALTGRVYCLADTSNGSIEPGDLLTTSQTPGHAMKVTDFVKCQGATIGKAMTGLERDKGLVLVLITLQ